MAPLVLLVMIVVKPLVEVTIGLELMLCYRCSLSSQGCAATLRCILTRVPHTLSLILEMARRLITHLMVMTCIAHVNLLIRAELLIV